MNQPVNAPSKRRRRRRTPNRLWQFRGAIDLGGKTPIITRPTAKGSQQIDDDEPDVVREARERIFRKIKKLLAKRRRKGTRVILKPRLRVDTTLL
jgi:hypothetical protein